MQVCFVSTYQEGKPPADATYFFTWLTEAVSDFRVGKEWLKKVCRVTRSVVGWSDHSTVVRSYPSSSMWLQSV